MPQIPTYTDQLTPQGSINASANGNDFGAQVGQATSQFGGAIQSAGEAVNRVEEDKARVWAYDAAAKQYTALKQKFNDHVNSLDPNAPDFSARVSNLTADFESQVNDATQQLVNAAPNHIGARVVASHMATNGRHLINMAMGEQARITGQYTGQLVQDGLKQDQDQIAADPSNANYQRIVESRSSMIGGLTTVDPVQKMKWQEAMTHGLAVTQVQSMAAVNPQGFLSLVNPQGGRTTKGGAVRGAVPGGAASFDSIVQKTLGIEGGYSATDGNSGAPVNFGINQRANPDIDVKNLTKDQAIQLYRDRYWNAIGADNLPANMRASAFDAAVNQGVPWTKAALEASGGDLAKFNAMREQRYRSIVANDPSQGKYLSGWLSRLSSYGNAPYFGPKDAPGMVAPGNIDLANRPVVHNSDGSISTVRSMSIEMDGKQFLIPTVSADGKTVLSDDDAIKQFQKTGQHLGVFDSPEHATAYAQSLHEDQAKMYANQGALPQVQPLDEAAIAGASPDIAGWGKLTWAEKVAAVRQAESAMGSQLASERGEMQRQLKDASASLLAGKDYPGLDDPKFSQSNLVRLFGPDEGKRAADQLQYVKQVGGFVGQMATMPNAQATAMLTTLAPEGGPEYAAKAPVFKQAVEAYTRLQKLRNDDYMAWAQSQQRLNVKPIDFTNPQAFGQSLGQRIGVAETGRTDYGADAHLLSQDEAAKLGGIVSKLTPQDQMAYLKQVRQATNGHDDWFTDTLAQIAPKNSMLAVAASTATKQGRVQTAAGAQNGEMIGQYILEGAHILQGKDIDDPQKSGRPVNFDQKLFESSFWNIVGPNAFSGPDANHQDQLRRDTMQAAKNYLVADAYKRGLPLDSIVGNKGAVENAITAVTGGTAKQNGSTLFIPWGMSKSQFQTQFPWALDAALQKGGIKGTKLDAPDAYQYANVGDGKYLVMTGNKALVGRDGRSVIVDMSRPPEGAGAGRGLTVPEPGFFGGYR